MATHRLTLAAFFVCCCGGLAACAGPQSALDPAGREAERIAGLFTWMLVGAGLIWAAVIGLALYAPYARDADNPRAQNALIIGGGVVFPLVVLTAHLSYGLSELPGILARAPDGRMSIEVTGSQWWWRVRYLAPGREPVELANELRLPVNERVDVRLISRDVIHSFWIPSIAGKIDLIPGRINLLPLQPTKIGTFRGACAEFCGASHARMNVTVSVTSRADFDAWLAAQARPAAAAAGELAARGQQAFMERGCTACHTVRGTPAMGRLGPDLTHVGSRQTIAAGMLRVTPDNLRRWISSTEHIKPDVRMPPFAVLPPDELDALAAYLAGLK